MGGYNDKYLFGSYEADRDYHRQVRKALEKISEEKNISQPDKDRVGKRRKYILIG